MRYHLTISNKSLDLKIDTKSHLSHGNNNLEKCLKCKKEYLRDFDTTEHRWYNDNHTNNHYTGRQCTVPGCGGDLIDSVSHAIPRCFVFR